MPTDYEKVYQQQRHALGEPNKAFVAFFDQYDRQSADILDIGCGQGRDALFIARRGHRVVGVDIANTGIAQLLEDARAEGLHVEGIVADLRDFIPTGTYDVLVIDRTLHMLDEVTRLAVLERSCERVREGGHVLIADEKSNIPRMKAFFESNSPLWTIRTDKAGLLFVQGQARSKPV